jgi:hypothetical protein
LNTSTALTGTDPTQNAKISITGVFGLGSICCDFANSDREMTLAQNFLGRRKKAPFSNQIELLEIMLKVAIQFGGPLQRTSQKT